MKGTSRSGGSKRRERGQGEAQKRSKKEKDESGFEPTGIPLPESHLRVNVASHGLFGSAACMLRFAAEQLRASHMCNSPPRADKNMPALACDGSPVSGWQNRPAREITERLEALRVKMLGTERC